LEHSVWTPYYIEPQSQYHRDITAENIPYVVICDIFSISMGEIEPATIKAVLPTSHIIGERTFGATGPLQPTTFIDLNYGGPFGGISSMHHYIYTSTFESSIGGQVLEGTGLTPDQEVLRKNHDGDFKSQLDAAIEYIQSVQ
jgi:C-terminal processing protease CtpA/Prc